MNKLIVSGFIVSLMFARCTWAKDAGDTQSVGSTAKKASNAAGSGMQQGGKIIAKDVKKVDDWLGSTLKKGGKQIEKAVK